MIMSRPNQLEKGPSGDRSTEIPDASPVTAIRNYLSGRARQTGVMLSASFALRTLDEAEKLSTLLAMNCPDPDRTAAGIWELLSNAVEHGNLEISFEEKTELLFSGQLREEIERRLNSSPYGEREVRVDFVRRPDAITLTVTDEGMGFDFKHFLEAEPALHLPNGRGINIASKFSFDALQYFGRGNRVEATIRI